MSTTKNVRLGLLAVGAAGLVWIGVAAQQQEMLPKPGPGSGIMDVRGTVSIAGVSEVRVANLPPVVVTGPTFLEKDARYTITWPTGEKEEVSVVEVGQGSGWVRVAHGGGRRWVNLDAALSVVAAR